MPQERVSVVCPLVARSRSHNHKSMQDPGVLLFDVTIVQQARYSKGFSCFP